MILDVPELSLDDIEAKSQGLIDEYWREAEGHQRENQTPVESIAEHHLGYEIEITDSGLFEDKNFLGGILFEQYKILINHSIEDHDGRFSFTLAHEIGHHVLHRDHYFAQKTDAEIICRETADKPLVEKQADQFAAALLMPRSIISDTFEALITTKVKTSGQAAKAAKAILSEAAIHNVSISAMINRLIDLQLIDSSIPFQSGNGIKSRRNLPWYLRPTYPLYKLLTNKN